MPSLRNRAVIAAAGSKKTQHILERALAAPPGRRVLITTYTRENTEQIIQRVKSVYGYVPPNVDVITWFSFLMNQCARPYQAVVTGQVDYAGSLNFTGERPSWAGHDKPRFYYFDGSGNFYRNSLSDFAVMANNKSGGRVVRRLEALYDEIYVDEFQDLVGYDLDFIDLLFNSNIDVSVVGDPRQFTYSTNRSPQNRQYRGAGLVRWLEDRVKAKRCVLEERTESWRCNQAICDWADRIFPEMAPTTSRNNTLTGHDEVVRLARDDVPVYVEKFTPTVLRWDKNTDTIGLPASNMKASKGCTFDRVLIFPPKTMIKFIAADGALELKAAREALYVAVTRARFSVAFVVDRKHANYTP
jgi:superfamily I DNA/RNA helicase